MKVREWEGEQVRAKKNDSLRIKDFKTERGRERRGRNEKEKMRELERGNESERMREVENKWGRNEVIHWESRMLKQMPRKREETISKINKKTR